MDDPLAGILWLRRVQNIEATDMNRLLPLAVTLAAGAYLAVAALGPEATRTTVIGSLQVIQVVDAANGDPSVPGLAASSAGLADLAELRPDFRNVSATRVTFLPGVIKATTPRGFAYESNRAMDVWLVEYSGPAQAGWSHVDGYSVVDAKTGRVLASGISGYND
jgi:hypothetical protein